MTDSLVGIKTALLAFVEATETQSQSHIRPLHQHFVQRLVIEGGFRPDELSPHPPLRIELVGKGKRARNILHFDPSEERKGEQTVLGGLKTKDVDIVASKRHVGPCLAISVKGTFNAFRNLTNRMEEAAGDCTNIHIAYPALVYGFLHVLRAHQWNDVQNKDDIAINEDGTVADSIRRYHDAMSRITNRTDLRNDVSRYEAVAIALVHPRGPNIAEVVGEYPLQSSAIAFELFFETLYRIYDLRYVYSAPALSRHTRRLEWDASSPVLESAIDIGLTPRIA